jgi:hypothetical protein
VRAFRFKNVKLFNRSSDMVVVTSFFLIGIVGGGVQLGALRTAATNGLLCQPQVVMTMEKLVQ